MTDSSTSAKRLLFISEQTPWPLTSGGTLVVAEDGGHRDPEYIATLLRKESVTTAFFALLA